MSSGIFFQNLKALGQRYMATGTQVTDSAAVNRACLDVFARNTATDPLYVSVVSGLRVRETRFHDCASVNINDNAGAFVEVGTGGYAAAIGANAILRVHVAAAFGEPITFRVAANAGAAAAAADAFILNRGGTAEFDVLISPGDRLWVRSLTAVSITDGILTLNLAG